MSKPTPNQRKALLELADTIERSPEFNMGLCSKCIYGHAKRNDEEITVRNMFEGAVQFCEHYGVLLRDFDSLIYPRPKSDRPGNTNNYDCMAETEDGDKFITQDHAAETLRHLAETGEVDWDFGAARLRASKSNHKVVA